MMTVSTAGSTLDRARSLVEGEFVMTSANFRAIVAMLQADSGIAIPESKATLVYSRLAKRLRILLLTRFDEYCQLVASPAGAGERREMLTALTTNVTRFFREPHHFEHMKKVLAPLLDAARHGARVRLWSAACSTGEEPYSMALTILSLLPNAAQFDVRILATDIDPAVLARGMAGRYNDAALAAVSPTLRQRWFTRDGGGGDQCCVADEMRQLVNFRELNLVSGDWPMKGRFHSLMCRNVVIYFNDETQAAIWKRFTPMLEPGGHLYIGHSERLTEAEDKHFESVGVTTYRRRDGAIR